MVLRATGTCRSLVRSDIPHFWAHIAMLLLTPDSIQYAAADWYVHNTVLGIASQAQTHAIVPVLLSRMMLKQLL